MTGMTSGPPLSRSFGRGPEPSKADISIASRQSEECVTLLAKESFGKITPPRGGKKRRLYQGWGVIGVTTPKA